MTRDEYLDAVCQIIKTNIGDGSLVAARLGQLVIRSLPNVRWQEFGFPSFKLLLIELKRLSKIDLSEPGSGVLQITLPVGAPPRSVTNLLPIPKIRFNPLKGDAWIAFVSPSPQGRRFISSTNGSIRLGLKEPPSPSDEWVEIQPISNDAQKAWIREFIESNELSEKLDWNHILGGVTWYRDFAANLKDIDGALIVTWNRTRSNKVSSHVQQWCEANKVEPQFVFQQHRASELSKARKVTFPACTERASGPRAAILSALSRMSTHELLDIPIPSKYWLSHDDRDDAT